MNRMAARQKEKETRGGRVEERESLTKGRRPVSQRAGWNGIKSNRSNGPDVGGDGDGAWRW